VCGDVLDIELPERSLDLVHARLVLMHIPERRRVLERIVSWLRPGGWLVVEELDWMATLADPDADTVALFEAFKEALPTMDYECGRALLRVAGRRVPGCNRPTCARTWSKGRRPSRIGCSYRSGR